MSTAARPRLYVVLKPEKQFVEIFRRKDFAQLVALSSQLLASIGAPAEFLDPARIEVAHAPPTDLHSTIEHDPQPDQAAEELILSYACESRALLERFYAFLVPHLRAAGKDAASVFINAGADPRGFFTCEGPRVSLAPRFGKRATARAMLGVAALTKRGLDGRGVNVVIIDRGLNKEAIVAHDPDCWGGGLASTTLDPEPGSAPASSHGMAIARSILDIAPKATLYEVPMIPSEIARVGVFASEANNKLRAVVSKIRQLRTANPQRKAWILVNAWAIFDRSTEGLPGNYTQNLGLPDGSVGHPLNLLMEEAVNDGIDVVFAAGNCGMFSGDRRCGKNDRGEKHSIWGANAHPMVVTVGAVSCEGGWMGYSSQGPQLWRTASVKKPDICAPSQFSEDNDAAVVNSGTSTATALTAGVMAAIRGSANPAYGPQRLPPLKLKEAMIATARGGQGGWNDRTGHGMLDADALVRRIEGPES
jgi:Subtilase family